MIHSLSGGIIADYDNLTYVFVDVEGGSKAWYICPFPGVAVGSKVIVPCASSTARGEVLRVECVTKQTAPYPVNRTREVEAVL